MNWTTTLKYSAIAIGLIIIAFGGFLGCIALIPPKLYQPPEVSIPDQTQYNLDEKVGWYKMKDGSEWLLTWRPHGGLLALNFVDFARDIMYPETKYNFTWVHKTDSLSVTFYDSSGFTQKFSWTDSTGISHTAQRMEKPYYQQRELSFTNGDLQLKGTLMIPAHLEIESAAVIIHGSGTSHRDNFWYLYQANYFAKQGIMILLPDKRGSGASEGEWHTASMEDFAEDAIAGAREIQNLNKPNASNLGFIGFSQGGAIAPLAASRFKDTDFVVNVVGNAVSYNEQLKFEIYNDVLARGVPNFLAMPVTSAYVKRAKARRPVWWAKNGDYNSAIYFAKLDIPSLIVYGGQDANVPVEASLENLNEIQEARQDNKITVKVFEDSRHGMYDPETEWIRKTYLDFLVEWVKEIPN